MRKNIIKTSFLLFPILLIAFLSFRFERQTSQPISASVITIKPSQESSIEKPEGKTGQKELFPVERVIDGDTIVVNMNGEQVRVRLIGVNSPELNDKRTQIACFAEQAKDEAEKLLYGKTVYLEKDPTQGGYDKYGRLLAYVFTESDSADSINSLQASSPQARTFFNKLMIENGYAYEYAYRLPYKYQTEFKTAQEEAKQLQKGLWNPNVCRK